MQELFKNLQEYFAEAYAFEHIQNFDMTDVRRFLPLAVIGLAIGVFIAICVSYYHGQYLGTVVRALYRADAFDEKRDGTSFRLFWQERIPTRSTRAFRRPLRAFFRRRKEGERSTRSSYKGEEEIL